MARESHRWRWRGLVRVPFGWSRYARSGSRGPAWSRWWRLNRSTTTGQVNSVITVINSQHGLELLSYHSSSAADTSTSGSRRIGRQLPKAREKSKRPYITYQTVQHGFFWGIGNAVHFPRATACNLPGIVLFCLASHLPDIDVETFDTTSESPKVDSRNDIAARHPPPRDASGGYEIYPPLAGFTFASSNNAVIYSKAVALTPSLIRWRNV